jgi:hypothetical protein
MLRTVQIPDDVYQQASLLAQQDHVSIDHAVAALVRDGVGEWSRLEARAARGSLTKLRSVLDKVGDSAPERVDEI